MFANPCSKEAGELANVKGAVGATGDRGRDGLDSRQARRRSGWAATGNTASVSIEPFGATPSNAFAPASTSSMGRLLRPSVMYAVPAFCNPQRSVWGRAFVLERCAGSPRSWRPTAPRERQGNGPPRVSRSRFLHGTRPHYSQPAPPTMAYICIARLMRVHPAANSVAYPSRGGGPPQPRASAMTNALHDAGSHTHCCALGALRAVAAHSHSRPALRCFLPLGAALLAIRCPDRYDNSGVRGGSAAGWRARARSVSQPAGAAWPRWPRAPAAHQAVAASVGGLFAVILAPVASLAHSVWLGSTARPNRARPSSHWPGGGSEVDLAGRDGESAF